MIVLYGVYDLSIRMCWYVHHHNLICYMDWCISHTGILNNQPSRSLLCRNMHITLLCSAQKLLHSVTITPVATPQAPQNAPCFPSTILHHILLALWQISKWYFTDLKMWLTSVVYSTWLYVFGKEDVETTYEINRRFAPLNTLKDQMNLNRFIILQKNNEVCRYNSVRNW